MAPKMGTSRKTFGVPPVLQKVDVKAKIDLKKIPSDFPELNLEIKNNQRKSNTKILNIYDFCGRNIFESLTTITMFFYKIRHKPTILGSPMSGNGI